MVKTSIPGMIFARAPSWTKEGKTVMGFILKRGPPWLGDASKLSDPQLSACIALGELAFSAYGTSGFANYKGRRMPKIAADLAVQLSGKSYGGLSKEQRRTANHQMARASLDSLRALKAR